MEFFFIIAIYLVVIVTSPGSQPQTSIIHTPMAQWSLHMWLGVIGVVFTVLGVRGAMALEILGGGKAVWPVRIILIIMALSCLELMNIISIADHLHLS